MDGFAELSMWPPSAWHWLARGLILLAIEMALGVLEYDMDDYLQYTLDETMRQLEK